VPGTALTPMFVGEEGEEAPCRGCSPSLGFSFAWQMTHSASFGVEPLPETELLVSAADGRASREWRVPARFGDRDWRAALAEGAMARPFTTDELSDDRDAIEDAAAPLRCTASFCFRSATRSFMLPFPLVAEGMVDQIASRAEG